ncbi:MAG: RNA polymerase sigma factor [Candidatus Cyclobacteriaceae bacterium M3_2C_046]
MKYSEHILWQNFRKGQPEALTSIFENYYADLFRYGYSLSKDKEITKDSIQEIFSELWYKRSAISPVKKIKPYLLIYLKRKILNYLSYRILDEDDQNSLQSSYYETPFENYLIDKETTETQQELLSKGLELLTPRQKDILFLKFYGGLTYKEIATANQIKIQSVRNMVYESLKILKKHLLQTLNHLLLFYFLMI